MVPTPSDGHIRRLKSILDRIDDLTRSIQQINRAAFGIQRSQADHQISVPSHAGTRGKHILRGLAQIRSQAHARQVVSCAVRIAQFDPSKAGGDFIKDRSSIINYIIRRARTCAAGERSNGRGAVRHPALRNAFRLRPVIDSFNLNRGLIVQNDRPAGGRQLEIEIVGSGKCAFSRKELHKSIGRNEGKRIDLIHGISVAEKDALQRDRRGA